jgi:hypothetical protein
VTPGNITTPGALEVRDQFASAGAAVDDSGLLFRSADRGLPRMSPR